MIVDHYRFASAPAGPLAEDSFDRADSTTTLGTADSGQAWTADVGTWGINGNKGYRVGTTDGAMATIDVGAADQTVSAVAVLVNGNYHGVVARMTDTNNFYLAQGNNARTQLYKRVAGTYTQLGSNGAAISNGDTLTLRVSGTSIKLIVGGVDRITATDSGLATGNRCGMRTGNTGADVCYYNDLLVEAP